MNHLRYRLFADHTQCKMFPSVGAVQSCQRLQYLGLDHIKELGEDSATALSRTGLRQLQRLELSGTPITSNTLKTFYSQSAVFFVFVVVVVGGGGVCSSSSSPFSSNTLKTFYSHSAVFFFFFVVVVGSAGCFCSSSPFSSNRCTGDIFAPLEKFMYFMLPCIPGDSYSFR